MGVALIWFAVFALWMVPHVAGGGTVYGPLYGSLGDSPSEVMQDGLQRPRARSSQRLDDNDALGWLRDLLAPFGFTPLAAPLVLMLGLPQALINLLSTANFTWDLRYHYQALPMAAAGLAMVEGVAWLGRRQIGVRRFAVGLGGGLRPGRHRGLGHHADQPRLPPWLLAAHAARRRALP